MGASARNRTRSPVVLSSAMNVMLVRLVVLSSSVNVFRLNFARGFVWSDFGKVVLEPFVLGVVLGAAMLSSIGRCALSSLSAWGVGVSMDRRIVPTVMVLPVIRSVVWQGGGRVGVIGWLYAQFLTIRGAVVSLMYSLAPPWWSSWLCVISHKSTDCPNCCKRRSSGRMACW